MASVIKKGRAVRAGDGIIGGWLATGVGVVVLVAMGFGLGMVAGVVSEEPELVGGHLAGRSETIDWGAIEAEEGDLPAVSAGGEDAGPSVDLPVLGEEADLESVASTPAESASEPVEIAVERAEPAPVRVAVAAQGSFGVQVGAFAKSVAAESMADDLRGRGYPVVVVPSATSGDRRWRVRVGPVSSRSEADALARRLQSQEKLPTWVLSDVSG